MKVENFKFLGSKSHRWMSTRTHERIKSAENFYQLVAGILRKWKSTRAGKICLFKNYYMPTLTYGAKTERYEYKLRATEMRLLRSVMEKP